jgi:hypothetical protein
VNSYLPTALEPVQPFHFKPQNPYHRANRKRNSGRDGCVSLIRFNDYRDQRRILPRSQHLQNLGAEMMVGKQIFRFGVGVVLTVAGVDCVRGQWPVSQTPIERSVPQYVSPAVDSASSPVPLDFFTPADQGLTGQQKLSLPAQPVVAGPKVNSLQQSKKVAEKETKKKADKKRKPAPVVDYSIYRDLSQYPIDHRKPCFSCGQGKPDCECGCGLKLPGNKGRPYRDTEPGGCECDSCRPWHHPNFSVHWPRPFSARLDERNPAAASARYEPCQGKRIVDIFDPLATFKLSKYQRQDNGYCGPGADRFGCLGESKLR